MTTELTAAHRIPRPGRLGDPAMSMRDDPRADPRMLGALAPAGLDVPPPPIPVPPDAPLEQLLAVCAAVEEGRSNCSAPFATAWSRFPG